MARFRPLFGLALLVVISLYLAPPARAQFPSPEGVQVSNTRWGVVLVDPNPSLIRISPPASSLQAQATSATFTVNYLPPGLYNGDRCLDWPNNAKSAFNYAVGIWGALLDSSVPITVDACWAQLSPGVLGYGGALSFRADFRNAPQSKTWYPAALANRLYGGDLEPSSSDVYLVLNAAIPWYFGTDGNTPQQSFDFVTVVLHELAHGLGFLGTMGFGEYYCGAPNQGCWGYPRWGSTIYPAIYDVFIRNGGGFRLIDTAVYPNPSVALGEQLRSNNLYFSGDYARAANGGNPPKIYAPSTWQPGSSYSHLDYDTFKDTPHRLMVFAISSGASIHHPGSVTLGILQDLGWRLVDFNLTYRVYLPLTVKR